MVPLSRPDLPRPRPEIKPVVKVDAKPSTLPPPQVALADGIEAGLDNPNATIGNLATLKTELASPTPETKKVDSVAPETGVKNTQQNIEPDKAAVAAVETAILDSKALIDTHVADKATEWDKQNPEPNRKADPDGWSNWAVKRAEAQTAARADGTVKAAMSNWEKTNAMPDKTKDPVAYNKWIEDRAKQEQTLRNEVGRQEQPKKESEEASDENKGENRKLSEPEKQKLRLRLEMLKREIGQLTSKIDVLILNPLKTKSNKEKLNALKSERNEKIKEAKNIEAMVGNASPLKKLLLAAVIAAGAGGAMILSASKDTPAQPH